MKVSEVIDQLEVGETVWVKATVDRINNEGKYIRAMPNTSSVYLDGNDEISLCDPQPEKVEVTEEQAELLRAFKGELLYELLANCLGEDEELMAKAHLYGYTVKPKQWVVKNDRGYVAMENFKDFKNQRVGVKLTITGEKSESLAWDDVDLEKAEAVATLVDGSVEEI